MKYFCLFVQILFVSVFSAAAASFSLDDLMSALDDLKSANDTAPGLYSVTDPEYEWSQTESKDVKVQLKAQALILESKKDNGMASSIVELPIDVENNAEFNFAINLVGPKLNDKNGIGMIFDYQDNHNYKALMISKKQYSYFVVKDGISSTVKTGLVKYKGIFYQLMLKRENGGAIFLLNGVEVCKLRKISLTSSYFGVFVSGKGKTSFSNFIMEVPEQEDTEQSTTDI